MSTMTAGQLGTWYRTYSAELLLYARQLTGATDAEDVVQEAFVRLMRQPGAPENVRAWLYRVVRNEAVSRMRRLQRACRRRSASRSPETPWFEARTEESLDAARAQDMLSALPRPAREIVVLRIWGQLSHKEIALLVKRPVSTVHHVYRRSLETLRQAMESESCQSRTG